MGSSVAGPGDIDRVAACLTHAFATDPIWSVALARLDGRTDHHKAYWRINVEGAMPFGTVHQWDSAAAVSVWIPPGENDLTPEFEALGRSFSDKGARADEYIDAIRSIWSDEQPAYSGKFVSFAGVAARPRPVQQPNPPIVIGGHSPGAFRRAIARGNGWYGFALDLDNTKRCLEGLRAAEQASERPAELGTLELSITPAVPLDRDTVRRYEDLGVDRLIPLSNERSPDGLVEFIEKLGAALL